MLRGFRLDQCDPLLAVILAAAIRIEPDRTGGFYCRSMGDSGTPIFLAQCGEVTPANVPRYASFAVEKNARLAQYPEHLTSWESRNDAAKQYPGAARIGKENDSFSGFSWEIDEAIVLLRAFLRRDINRDYVDLVITITGNTKWKALYRETCVPGFVPPMP